MHDIVDRVKDSRAAQWLDVLFKFVGWLRNAAITIFVIYLAILFFRTRIEVQFAVDQGWKATPLLTVIDLSQNSQQYNHRLVSVVGFPQFEGISSASEQVVDWGGVSTCRRTAEETTYKLHQDDSPDSPNIYMIVERKSCMSGWTDTELPDEKTRFTGWWSSDEHHITTKDGARKRDVDTYTLWIESDGSG
jgi:hypothetical protein